MKQRAIVPIDMSIPSGSGNSFASVTISDVAAAAGVSVRTVSRVLNASPKVGEDTRKTIEAVIDRLGFRPNSRARGLAVGRSYLIGVVQDDPNAHVIGILQRSIAAVCGEQGFELLVHPAPYADPGIVDNIVDFVRRSQVDGLLLLPPLSELSSVAKALTEIGTPVVALASIRTPEHAAMLVSDERGAAMGVARYLVRLGHRRIAHISGPQPFHSAAERAEGFCAALAEAGMPIRAEYLRAGDYSFASGLAAARDLLALPEPPTAIFAGNDNMAAAVLKAAIERRLVVPDQLSVVGFDDSDIASMVTPALTTIRRPLAEVARIATDKLLAMVTRGAASSCGDQAVELSLIERESSGPVPVPTLANKV